MVKSGELPWPRGWGINLVLDILAHGFNSVKKETYQKMYSVVMDFAGIKQEDLIQFPVLSL